MAEQEMLLDTDTIKAACHTSRWGRHKKKERRTQRHTAPAPGTLHCKKRIAQYGQS